MYKLNMCKNTGEDLKGKGPHLFQSSKVEEKKIFSDFISGRKIWKFVGNFLYLLRRFEKVTTFSNYGFKVGLRQSIIIEPEQKKTNTVQKTVRFLEFNLDKDKYKYKTNKCHRCREICCITLPFYGNL